MAFQVQIKICGITREDDLYLALECGADYLGFIVYPDSPRGLTLKRAIELGALAPEGKRVLVDVEPTMEALHAYNEAGFDRFQLHARTEVDPATLAGWSKIVGPERLWLAPRLVPGEPFPERALAFANTILVDSYSREKMGGTGVTGNWERFAQWQRAYPSVDWVLAGGLGPSNASEAVTAGEAKCIDVNSGIEASPGQKDPERLRELFRTLRS
ncbi:MAG: phosphoribosylanthranilate isomerase [Opitutales bacterium]